MSRSTPEGQGHVVAAEAERVRQGDAGGQWAWSHAYDVQRHVVVGIVEVAGRRHLLVDQAEYRHRGFERTGCAEQVPGARFGGGDTCVVGGITKSGADR